MRAWTTPLLMAHVWPWSADINLNPAKQRQPNRRFALQYIWQWNSPSSNLCQWQYPRFYSCHAHSNHAFYVNSISNKISHFNSTHIRNKWFSFRNTESTRKHSSRMRTDHTVTSDWVANKDEQWPSRHEANCGQNDRRLWKHYLPLRSVIISISGYGLPLLRVSSIAAVYASLEGLYPFIARCR